MSDKSAERGEGHHAAGSQIAAVLCIVPIQQHVDERRFDHFGSSILLAIEDRQMLISAAHVVLGDDLWMFGEPRNIPLDGIAFTTTSPDYASALKDSTDVAFAELSEEIAALLKNFGFEAWPLKDTAYVSRPSNERAAFSGFPETKANFHVGLRRMKLQPGFIDGTLLSPAELAAAGLDPDIHLAIPYRRKRQYDAHTKQAVTGPLPYGMSGGPVWRFGADKTPWLAGIGFKFDEEQELLIGTRIEVVLELIQQQSIESWIARQKRSVRKMIFNLKTGKLEEDSGEPKPEQPKGPA